MGARGRGALTRATGGGAGTAREPTSGERLSTGMISAVNALPLPRNFATISPTLAAVTDGAIRVMTVTPDELSTAAVGTIMNRFTTIARSAANASVEASSRARQLTRMPGDRRREIAEARRDAQQLTNVADRSRGVVARAREIMSSRGAL